MGKREEYKLAWCDLLSAKTEDEVVNKLLKIVKSFNVDFYKSDVLNNPYFKSLLDEVRQIVISELKEIKSSLKLELDGVKEELKRLKSLKIDDKDVVKQLKSLKSDCQLLISELEERIDDLRFNLELN